MKKLIILFSVVLLIPIFGFTQTTKNLDYISPFHDGLAAIEKDGQWAFIDAKGDIVVDFRNDLVTTKLNSEEYPVFMDGRCLIEQKKAGISYFGYIDSTGETIIKPQFLNATNFSKGQAIALELVKEIVGKNQALEKDVVYYKYYEAIIDTTGNIYNYLTQKGINVVLDKDFLRQRPKIDSRQISKDVYAVIDTQNTWSIIKL
jgi:hypothetical protein